jgi:TolB-like protein
MVENLGQYRILDRIGAGGMGEVFRARDTRLGRTVAIKVMAAGVAGDPERRARFLQEARAAAALSHPNIAALYEIGEDQGQLFLAFEFVPGETLAQLIGGRPMNPRRAIDLAAQIADALADAHSEGIVHRDIKPANIIVTPKGNAKILDFGLATWTAGGAEREHAADGATVLVTAAGAMQGTVAYMSPEQALGERVDHRTDIFSLGVVIFEMFTGRLPFTAATSTALALQIVQALAPAPSAVNKSLPIELDPIVAKALAKSIDHRYESAVTLSAELRSVGAILDVRSDSAAPVSVQGTTHVPRRGSGGKWLALVLLLIALGVAAWLARATIEQMWRRTLGPAPSPVIAVIPLDLADGDASQTFFANGLTDDLITHLGQQPGLRVLGRSATRHYRGRSPRDVAEELGAALVLTGSVRPSADTVTMTLALVTPSDGTAVWSAQYTRDMRNIFAVQAEVASDVANALRLKLQPTASSARAASRLVDQRAYTWYLRGRQATAEGRLPEAISAYDQAIGVDPGLVEAFAGMAEALHLQVAFTGAPDDRTHGDRLRTAAERAYQLDPDLPQANVAMGLSSEPLADALKYLRRAVELDASYAEAHHLIGDQLHDFDPERAIAFFRQSLALDPRLDVSRTRIASALGLLGRDEEARRELAAMARPDSHLGLISAMRAATDLRAGRYEQAAATLAAMRDVRSAPPFWSSLVAAFRLSGRTDDALTEATLLATRFPQDCEARVMLAALQLERRDAASAHRLAGGPLAVANLESPLPSDIRCGLHAAAALQDGGRAAALLVRVAAQEGPLRAFAAVVMGQSGAMWVEPRMYPWSLVAAQPRVVAARTQLAAAYAREREIAKAALAGLP